MMQETYGHHKTVISRTLSDSLNDTVSQTKNLSSSSSPDIKPVDYNLLPFSSQESSSFWHSSSRLRFQEDYSHNGGVRRAKRMRKCEAFTFTSTLHKAQEFDEVMEYENEIRFALDGLRKGQRVSIRRESLSLLLSICASQHHPRSLRSHGISQSIIDVILELSLDDIPSNLAAATLFFVLTADDQGDHFMESPKCIKFLIKLLKPVIVTATYANPHRIGFRLLSLRKDVNIAHDPSSSGILSRVQKVLVNCKEMRLSDSYKTLATRPELSTKWVALLAMERAFLSKISFYDFSRSWKKTGEDLKKKMRELGGLDAVVEVVMDCHTVMERWVECDTFSVQENKDNLHKQNLMLLLKCLKIMENATIRSTDNQNHLLRFKTLRSQLSFTEFTISVIRMFSGLHLRGGFPSPNRNNVNPRYSNGGNRDSMLGVDRKGSLTSLGRGIARCTSRTSQDGEPSCRKNGDSASPEEREDPFALDMEDSKPSKWAVKQKKSTSQKKQGCYRKSKDESLHQLFSSREESSNRDCSTSLQLSSCTNDIDEECLCLLFDCLLTAIKVLMNLTNDNAFGCQQVAKCRGLESLAELIVGHFPFFTSSPFFSEMEKTGSSHQKKDKHLTDLTDQEFEFLVIILGLLVNLVMKNGRNRSRLASVSVPITKPEGLQESERQMIPLLCSIFLTNQGSAETNEETTTFTLDDDLECQKEADRTIVEAYSALILAFLSTESRSIRNSIKDHLPKRNIAILVPVLERFVAFHITLNVIPPETHKALMEVIESCKLP